MEPVVWFYVVGTIDRDEGGGWHFNLSRRVSNYGRPLDEVAAFLEYEEAAAELKKLSDGWRRCRCSRHFHQHLAVARLFRANDGAEWYSLATTP